MSSPLLEAEGVHKSYAMGRSRLEVLRGCDLRVAPGEFVAIMGKSGSGKSTLLQILGALDAPDRGQVHFSGRAVCAPEGALAQTAAPLDAFLGVTQALVVVGLKCLVALVLVAFPILLLSFPALLSRFPGILHVFLYVAFVALGLLVLLLLLLTVVLLIRLLLVDTAERRRTFLRRRDFGFVFQSYHLLPELSVLENVLLARMTGASTFTWLREAGPCRGAALDVLERVGLQERLRHRPSELSGGEGQRVAIARALVHRPRILFADEPTGNLDAEAGAELMALLKELHAEGQTIVMVTHDPGIAGRADRILRLENGQLHPA